LRQVRRYGELVGGRARYYWSGFLGADPLLQIISVVALVILLVVIMPYIVPTALIESQCGDLAGPTITGNNRSILALQADPSVLRLTLSAQQTTISQGQPLVLNVRFVNGSMGPLTLYYIPDSVLLRYTGQEIGLQFAVQDASGRSLGEPRTAQQAWAEPPQYAPDQMHVLGPHQQCLARVQLDTGRLNAAGIVNGAFRFTAVYINQSKGELPPVVAPTPTAIFKDQGVWTGNVQSNTIVVNIGPPPTLQPK